MNSTRYEVLIIGCGNIAGGFDVERLSSLPPLSHAGAYAKHEGFRLSACVDPDQERREAFAMCWDVGTQAADLTSLDASPGAFDVISICSPTAFHHQHLSDALQLAPRVIFCEKPLTLTVAQSREWVAACAAQGVKLVVNYTRQWDPAVQSLIDGLAAGRWGAIRSVAAFYNKGILNNGGHLIDLLYRILGPLDVIAATGVEHDFWPDDPTVAALLRSAESGVPVSLNPSNARDYSFFELELVCENGVIRMRDGGLQWEIREAGSSSHFKGYRALGPTETRAGEYLCAMTGAVTEIYDYLYQGCAVRSTGEHALAVHTVCASILEMAKNFAPSTKPQLK